VLTGESGSLTTPTVIGTSRAQRSYGAMPDDFGVPFLGRARLRRALPRLPYPELGRTT
jgi:hypothetical protein